MIAPPQTDMTYQFNDSARVPSGVTPAGVMEERERIITLRGRATARETADAILEDEQAFPNLRAFGPDSPEAAYREAMEEGVRRAYRSIVVVKAGPDSTERPVRVLFAVPVPGTRDLSYEPVTLIRKDTGQRRWLIEQLRRDAHAFAQKLEDVLAEIGELV